MMKHLLRFFMKRSTWSIPYVIFLLLFVVLPLILIFLYAFQDADGNFTKVWSSKETTFTVAGCSPAEEFFAAGATAAKHNAKRPTAKHLTLE